MQPINKTQVDVGGSKTVKQVDHARVVRAEFISARKGWHYDYGAPGMPIMRRQVEGPDHQRAIHVSLPAIASGPQVDPGDVPERVLRAGAQWSASFAAG